MPENQIDPLIDSAVIRAAAKVIDDVIPGNWLVDGIDIAHALADAGLLVDRVPDA